jgi:hypothetical protein
MYYDMMYRVLLQRAPVIETLKSQLHPSDISVQYYFHLPHSLLYTAAAEAKFVFCPSGLGLDTFRLWESLVLGAIPVVESNKGGLDRTYGSLPVLVVRSFEDVTAPLLREAYGCFRRHAGVFSYEHLTMGYWVDVVRAVQRTGSSEVYNAEHPAVNHYCNFMHR